MQEFKAYESMGLKQEILEVTDIELSNQTAKKFIYQYIDLKEKKTEQKTMQIISLYNNNIYSIVYWMDNPDLYEVHLPTAEKMINSMKFP